MSETLDLSGAKFGAFDIPPPDWYTVHVERIEDIAIDNDSGKLPMGTPGYNFAFVIDDGPQADKWVFNRFWLPKAGEYDESKRATFVSRFADLLVALGHSEKDIQSGKFKFDKDENLNRQLRILVGENNGYATVRNYKPIGGDIAEEGIL